MLHVFGESVNIAVLIKLLIALGFGFIIGLEREMRKKSIGIRTCAVISVVSCLLTIVSIEAASKYALPYERPMDPLRLAAQIVSGIGFIGAGVILRRSNNIVSGLTTAAIVWGVSGIGISIGAGFIIEALTAVILIFIGVEVVPFFLKQFNLFRTNDQFYSITIKMRDDLNLNMILDNLKEEKITIQEIKIEDDFEHINIQIRAYVSRKQSIESLYHRIKFISGVERIKIE